MELSYSTSGNNSTVLGSNLFGLSGNISLTNRNVGREAIRMTHKISAGIELNSNTGSTNNELINSNILSYNNNILFPRLIFPGVLRFFNNPFSKKRDSIRLPNGQTFINTNLSYNNRLDLYKQQSAGLNFGWNWLDKHNIRWEVRPFNIGFSRLYNESDSFKTILLENPYLKYSFNTAFVMGMGAGFLHVYNNPVHLKSLSKSRSIKINFEESGLTWANLGILKNTFAGILK